MKLLDTYNEIGTNRLPELNAVLNNTILENVRDEMQLEINQYLDYVSIELYSWYVSNKESISTPIPFKDATEIKALINNIIYDELQTFIDSSESIISYNWNKLLYKHIVDVVNYIPLIIRINPNKSEKIKYQIGYINNTVDVDGITIFDQDYLHPSGKFIMSEKLDGKIKSIMNTMDSTNVDDILKDVLSTMSNLVSRKQDLFTDEGIRDLIERGKVQWLSASTILKHHEIKSIFSDISNGFKILETSIESNTLRSSLYSQSGVLNTKFLFDNLIAEDLEALTKNIDNENDIQQDLMKINTKNSKARIIEYSTVEQYLFKTSLINLFQETDDICNSPSSKQAVQVLSRYVRNSYDSEKGHFTKTNWTSEVVEIISSSKIKFDSIQKQVAFTTWFAYFHKTMRVVDEQIQSQPIKNRLTEINHVLFSEKTKNNICKMLYRKLIFAVDGFNKRTPLKSLVDKLTLMMQEQTEPDSIKYFHTLAEHYQYNSTNQLTSSIFTRLNRIEQYVVGDEVYDFEYQNFNAINKVTQLLKSIIIGNQLVDCDDAEFNSAYKAFANLTSVLNSGINLDTSVPGTPPAHSLVNFIPHFSFTANMDLKTVSNGNLFVAASNGHRIVGLLGVLYSTTIVSSHQTQTRLPFMIKADEQEYTIPSNLAPSVYIINMPSHIQVLKNYREDLVFDNILLLENLNKIEEIVDYNELLTDENLSDDERRLIEFKALLSEQAKMKPNNLIMRDSQWKLLVRNCLRAKNTMIVGESGCGKTVSVQELSKTLNRPLYYINMGSTQDPRTSLLGTTQYSKEKGTHFVKSSFIKALTTPNQIILLDELSRAHPEATNILMTVLDAKQRYIRIDETNEVIEIDSSVSFFATANVGSQYTATRVLDRAIQDRFQITEVGMLDFDGNLSLMNTFYPNSTLNEELARIADQVKGEYLDPDGQLTQFISTRVLLEAAQLAEDGFNLLDISKELIETLFEDDGSGDDERTFIRQVVERYNK